MKEVYFQKQYRFAKLDLSWVWGGGDIPLILKSFEICLEIIL